MGSITTTKNDHNYSAQLYRTLTSDLSFPPFASVPYQPFASVPTPSPHPPSVAGTKSLVTWTPSTRSNSPKPRTRQPSARAPRHANELELISITRRLPETTESGEEAARCGDGGRGRGGHCDKFHSYCCTCTCTSALSARASIYGHQSEAELFRVRRMGRQREEVVGKCKTTLQPAGPVTHDVNSAGGREGGGRVEGGERLIDQKQTSGSADVAFDHNAITVSPTKI